MSQDMLKRDGGFPTGLGATQDRASHQDPGDMLNGIQIPGKKQRDEKASKKKGKKLLLCPICGEESCCYTVEADEDRE